MNLGDTYRIKEIVHAVKYVPGENMEDGVRKCTNWKREHIDRPFIIKAPLIGTQDVHLGDIIVTHEDGTREVMTEKRFEELYERYPVVSKPESLPIGVYIEECESVKAVGIPLYGISGADKTVDMSKKSDASVFRYSPEGGIVK